MKKSKLQDEECEKLVNYAATILNIKTIQIWKLHRGSSNSPRWIARPLSLRRFSNSLRSRKHKHPPGNAGTDTHNAAANFARRNKPAAQRLAKDIPHYYYKLSRYKPPYIHHGCAQHTYAHQFHHVAPPCNAAIPNKPRQLITDGQYSKTPPVYQCAPHRSNFRA